MNNESLVGKSIVVLLVVVGFLFGLWHFGIIGKSDEDKIRERLDSFVTSYNNGDFEGILECIEPVRRRQYESATNIMGSIGSGLLGFDFSVSDLVGLGAIFMPEEEKLHFEITKISVQDGGSAIVHISNSDGEGKITMVKYNNEWYLAI